MKRKSTTTDQTSPNDFCSTDVVSKFLAAELSPRDITAFEDHLENCHACQARLNDATANASVWDEARCSLTPMPNQNLSEGNLNSKINFDNSSESEVESRFGLSQLVLKSLAPSEDPAMLGRIGPYEISGVIGQGGMGVVLKAHDPSLRRLVAVKVLAPHLAASGAARQRFFREAQAAATVTHENVVPIHSVAEGSELPYLVMPYIRGESLQKRISNVGRLDLVSIVRIGMQMASGLGAAHSQGLVHRDIKPANIILEEGVDRLLITDFGLARTVDDASLTRTGVIAGTPEYMSPEQARGESVGVASDLFSLGSVMYAMCTGHSPFRAETSYGVLRKITDNQPRPIREINESIPAWLESLIFRLLSKCPEDRFESTEQVAELLKQCLAHVQHPTAIELPDAVSKLVPRRASSRKVAVLVAVAVAAMVGLIGLSQSLGIFAAPIAKNESPNQISTIAPVLPQEIITQLRSEHLLSSRTDVWVSIPDVNKLKTQFAKTQFGELFADDSMQPFVGELRNTLGELMNKDELIFGLELFEKTDWITGEVAFGMAMPGDLAPQLVKFLVVDVSKTQNEAIKMLSDLNKTETNTNKGTTNVSGFDGHSTDGSEISIFFGTYSNQGAHFAIHQGWLVASDNATALNSITKKLKEKHVSNLALARTKAFKTSMDRSFIPGVESNLRWFVNPLDFLRIADGLGQSNPNNKRNNWISVLEKNGFDAFSGIGGNLSFATDDHELLHREFISTTPIKSAPNQTRHILARGLFNFDNGNVTPIHPPAWISDSASRCMAGNWNMANALESVGPLYDGFLSESGAFERLLADLKKDPDLDFDLPRFVAAFDRQFVSFAHPTETKDNFEQSLLCFKIKQGKKYVIKSIKSLHGNQFKTHNILGFEVYESTETKGVDTAFDLPEDPNDTESELPPKFYVVAEDYLIIAHDKSVLETVLQNLEANRLSGSDDYQEVYTSLERLTNPKNISIRQFARLDQCVEPLYVSYRNGELGLEDFVSDDFLDAASLMFFDFSFVMPSASEIAWAVGRSILTSDKKKPLELQVPVEKNKIFTAGAALPADFQNQVAPKLGTAGWVLESEQGGWRITGCVLGN